MVGQLAMSHQTRGTVLSYDGVNAINSTKRSRTLPVPARNVPPVARYESNPCAGTPPKLLIPMKESHVQVVCSITGS